MSADPGVSAFPDGDNLFKWIGTIEGGKGTVSTLYHNILHVSGGRTWTTFLMQ